MARAGTGAMQRIDDETAVVVTAYARNLYGVK